MLSKKQYHPLGIEDAVAARAAVRVLVAFGAPTLLFALLALTASVPARARFFDNVHWSLSFVGSACLAWLGVRIAKPSERAPKRWLAWGLSFYGFGQLLWVGQVASGWTPFPAPSDIFYVCMGPLTCIGLGRLLLARADRAARKTALLDGAGLSVAVLALTLALYLPRRGGLLLSQLSFLVAYPFFLCGAACLAFNLLLALPARLDRGWGLFLPSLLVNALLWLHWNSLILDDALSDGSLFNAAFSLCALTQGAGVLLLHDDRSESEWWISASETLRRLMPLFFVVLSAGAVIAAYTLPAVPHAVRLCALLGGLLVLVLASVRQSVLLGERERLIRAERELRRAEETFRVLVEQAADGIFLSDERGNYLDVNSRGAEMLGMKREEVIGKNIADVVQPEERERIGPEVARLLRGETVSSSWLFLRKDGSSFRGELTGKQLSDGRLQGFVRDVSERLALEAQLRQSQKLEAIGALAAGIAHDFNNVLSAIRGNAVLAAEDLGPNHPVTPFVEDIERAGKRATELVQRLLSVARPRPPAMEPVDLNALVEEVVKLLRPVIPSNVELLTTLESPACVVAADPFQLHQLLMNLSNNAWQALAGKPGTVEFRLMRWQLEHTLPGFTLPPGEYARLDVVDDGQGMNSNTLERIFDPFFTTKPPGQGTGLGLSLAHGIVKAHRGALRVNSSVGLGSTFTLYFPALQEQISEPSLPAPMRSLVVPAASNSRIAYVDDEPQLASLMPIQLQRRGYQTRGFTLASELLELLAKDPNAFDVVVTDYNMPAISGLGLIRAARQLNPELGFVLTSGYLSDELCHEIAQLEIAGPVRKPESVDELCRAIEQAARKHPREASTVSA